MLPILWNDSAFAPVTGGPINRLDSFFDRVLGEDDLSGRGRAGVPVALWEDEDHIYVEADLPGMTHRDVDITVHDGMLFIRGARELEESRDYLYNGRLDGGFERVIVLPVAVTTDGAQARLTDGVLSITLPKSPGAKPRKIALEAS